MATEKQKRAYKNSMENYGNVSQAMTQAGYAPNSAKNPQFLTRSKGWAELYDQDFPYEWRKNKLQQLADAKRIHSSPTEPDKEVDDSRIQLDSLKEINKLSGAYPAEKHEITGADGKDFLPIIPKELLPANNTDKLVDEVQKNDRILQNAQTKKEN